jgi:hypothetical protein
MGIRVALEQYAFRCDLKSRTWQELQIMRVTYQSSLEEMRQGRFMSCEDEGSIPETIQQIAMIDGEIAARNT